MKKRLKIGLITSDDKQRFPTEYSGNGDFRLYTREIKRIMPRGHLPGRIAGVGWIIWSWRAL